MEIKVKALDGSQEKSQSEKEQELLNKHEGQEQTQETVTQQEEVATSTEAPQEENPVVEEKSSLNEEDIISYLKNKHNKEITSVDELFQKREEEPLPEDVAFYLKLCFPTLNIMLPARKNASTNMITRKDHLPKFRQPIKNVLCG